ncbi:MAG: CPBP family intramembrane metalloprotease [Lachnospiraceae bacterium]|jgi:membrane protease YdiL (CAAX protease family)|nr:CPBP family intramembrane metalloprotease [Lachnospiraceae bacterium]
MKIFINKHGEFRSGWTLAFALLAWLFVQMITVVIITIVAGVQAGMAMAREPAADPAAVTEAVIATAAAMSEAPPTYILMNAVMSGVMFLLFYVVYKRPVEQIGFYKEGWLKHLLLGGLFGIALIVLAAVILYVSGTATISAVQIGHLGRLAWWAGLLMMVAVGFTEELLSRGIMMTALKTTRNKWAIVLIPAVIFGIMHMGNSNVTVFSVINIVLVGVLFAYLFVKTGRLWAPIGFHITWNFVQGYVLGVPVSGLGSIVENSVMATVFTGPDWLTGGAFGIEGGAACTLVNIAGLVFIHFCLKQSEGLWGFDSDMPLTREVPAQEGQAAHE